MSTITDNQRRELNDLAQRPDSEIDTSNVPELADLSGGVRGRFYRPPARPVTLAIDADILDWFTDHGEPVQSHINTALRGYLAHLREQA